MISRVWDQTYSTKDWYDQDDMIYRDQSSSPTRWVVPKTRHLVSSSSGTATPGDQYNQMGAGWNPAGWR